LGDAKLWLEIGTTPNMFATHAFVAQILEWQVMDEIQSLWDSTPAVHDLKMPSGFRANLALSSYYARYSRSTD
jgi:hypothetical protein